MCPHRTVYSNKFTNCGARQMLAGQCNACPGQGCRRCCRLSSDATPMCCTSLAHQTRSSMSRRIAGVLRRGQMRSGYLGGNVTYRILFARTDQSSTVVKKQNLWGNSGPRHQKHQDRLSQTKKLAVQFSTVHNRRAAAGIPCRGCGAPRCSHYSVVLSRTPSGAAQFYQTQKN